MPNHKSPITNHQSLRYPVGKFVQDREVTPEKRKQWIGEIARLPERLRQALQQAPDHDAPYRPGGWTVRQLVHHVADSHLNAYVRFRLALTEENPSVKTYDQEKWAELADAREAPVESSLAILDGLHRRWARLLESLSEQDFARKLQHPEWGRIDLDVILQIYAWHSRHHVAHVSGSAAAAV